MPKNTLIGFFGSRYPLSKNLIAFLESKASLERRVLKKGHLLLVPKMAVDELYYLERGLCKGYWLDTNNEQQIFALWEQDNMVMLAEEFFCELKNTCCYIELLEDSELLIITKDQWDMMQAAFQELRQVMDLIRAEHMQRQHHRLRMLMKKEGDRYAIFCDWLPLALRVRLTDKDSCALMGISRSTLGRIKAPRKRKSQARDLKMSQMGQKNVSK